jgi:hypothetical protein
MRSQIYLVLIRDGSLALAVGAGLEDRLLRDGSRAMALVPAVRGPEFADSDYGRQLAMRRPGSEPVGHRPQVVALYEDGLLAGLASLGLPAYVGVRDGDEPRVARWAGGLGAIMLPAATARDLVDAVADHTPWSRYAAEYPAAECPAAWAGAAPVVPGARQSGHDRLSVRSRRVVTVASVAAGPLLLAGLPPVAIAASGVSQPPALAATASSATAPVLAADTQQAPPAAAATPANTGTTNTWGDYFTNLGTGLQNYTNATVTGAGNFLLGQAGDAFSNYVTQSAQGNSASWSTLAQDGNAAAVQAGTSGCLWTEPYGVAADGLICAAPGTAAATETGPGGSAAGSANQLAPGRTTSSAGSAQQTGITTNSASSGVQPGQTPAKAGAGGGLETASLSSQSRPSSSQSSTPASSRTPQSGTAHASTPAPTRKVAARGGGGGGGGIPREPAVAPSATAAPIHATPIPPLNPGTPVTTLAKIPRQSPDQGSLPLGDYYPDGSDSPNGSGNPVMVAGGDTGGSGDDDTGDSQGGAVMMASNNGSSGGGTTAGAPAATPVAPISDDQPPTSIGGNTSVFASATSLMNGSNGGLEDDTGDGDDGSGGGMMTG